MIEYIAVICELLRHHSNHIRVYCRSSGCVSIGNVSDPQDSSPDFLT